MTLDYAFLNKTNNFTFIRLLAALGVIYMHSYAVTGVVGADLVLQITGYKGAGGLAVDIFFVISGFLLTYSIRSKANLLFYIKSRILRIYPALICSMLLTTFVLGGLISSSQNYFTDPQTWRYFCANSSAFLTEYFLPGVFVNLPDHAVNGSIWSIQLEMRMYILILILYMARIFRYPVVFNCIFFSFLIYSFTFPGPITSFFGGEGPARVAFMFLLGIFYAMNARLIPLNWWVLFIFLMLAAITHGTSKFHIAYALAIPYALFIFAYIPCRWNLDRYGDASYGVYLYGWPVQQTLLLFFKDISPAMNTILACLISLVLGFASWHFVEKPFSKFKGKIKSQLKPI